MWTNHFRKNNRELMRRADIYGDWDLPQIRRLTGDQR